MKQSRRKSIDSNALGIRDAQLSLLIDMDQPRSVLKEILSIAGSLHPRADLRPINALFTDIVSLFSGSYPGFKACSTGYHNLKHTTDTALAMARLIHGAQLQGAAVSSREMMLGLMAAILHDVGYIQHTADGDGTGARLAPVHIQRSIDFMTRYFGEKDFPRADIQWVENAIRCTDLGSPIDAIRFCGVNDRTLGQMLAASDLLAQTADRNYLEKLPRLYLEFKEAGWLNDETELDFIRDALTFNQRMEQRLKNDLDGVHGHMKAHFTARWNIRQDLYQDSIRKSMHYLSSVLLQNSAHYPDYLRRKRGA